MPYRHTPLRDPEHVADAFAQGVDVENHGDFVRLTFWRAVETLGGQLRGRRVKLRVVMPLANYRLAAGEMTTPEALGV